MTHYSTEIAGTLSRASADAYRPKNEAQMVGLNWQADDAEFIEEDDSTALLIADGSSLIVAHRGTQITSVTDWRNNLDLETGETLCGKVRLKSHAGFFVAWRAATLSSQLVIRYRTNFAVQSHVSENNPTLRSIRFQSVDGPEIRFVGLAMDGHRARSQTTMAANS